MAVGRFDLVFASGASLQVLGTPEEALYEIEMGHWGTFVRLERIREAGAEPDETWLGAVGLLDQLVYIAPPQSIGLPWVPTSRLGFGQWGEGAHVLEVPGHPDDVARSLFQNRFMIGGYHDREVLCSSLRGPGGWKALIAITRVLVIEAGKRDLDTEVHRSDEPSRPIRKQHP